MGDHSALERFLATDPVDVGCAEAMRVLDIYAELLAADGNVATRDPGVAAHLAACGPCAEDLAGLVAAIAEAT